LATLEQILKKRRIKKFSNGKQWTNFPIFKINEHSFSRGEIEANVLI
jgi:hypothetical protein